MRTVALIRATLRLTEPGGVTVTAPPGRDTIDLAIDRDTSGRPAIPGTTLAGALRDLVRGYGGDVLADQLFGHLTEIDRGSDTVDAVASPIWIFDAAAVTVCQDASEVRQRTAIDRERAAASNRTLHTEELLAAGTTFEAFLRWDDPDPSALATLLAHMGAWQPLIGHAVTSGRGRVTIDTLTYVLLDLEQPEHLAIWLTDHGPDLFRRHATLPPPQPPAPIPMPAAATQIRIGVSFDGPLHIGSGAKSRDSDTGPEIARLFRSNGHYTVPGTALKGLLRSRCEYILRSVDAAPSPCPNQQCGHCWPCDVFGHAGGTIRNGTVGRRGLLRILDARIDAKPCRRVHVAIDRFTGGARDENLFTVDTLEDGRFTIVMEWLADAADSREPQLRALLRLVAEDMADGLIGLGAHVTRGYGTIRPDLSTAGLPTLDDAQATLRTMIMNGQSA